MIKGCLPNPEKNESVLKSFVVYAIKAHKQSLTNNDESSILSMFKQALADGVTAKEAYSLAVCTQILERFLFMYVFT